jgi:hypothetical protein
MIVCLAISTLIQHAVMKDTHGIGPFETLVHPHLAMR